MGADPVVGQAATGRDVARLWAGFALLGAGLVHLAVVRDHLAESAVHGAFFAVVGAVQVGWSLLALAGRAVPAPRLWVLGQLGLVALWAVSRTVGLPVPPEAWTPEEIGTADLGAVALELVAVAAAFLAAAASRTPVRAGPASRLLLGAGVGALVVAAITTPALAATDAGAHAQPHGHHGG